MVIAKTSLQRALRCTLAINETPDYDAEVEKLVTMFARTEAASLFANQFFPEEMLGAVSVLPRAMVLEHVMDALEGGPSNGAVEVSRETEQICAR